MTRPAGGSSQQELPQDDELLEHDDELLPHEDELLHDDELLPQDDELLSQDDDPLPHDEPACAVPMTYQDASWVALAFVHDPLALEPPTRAPVWGRPGSRSVACLRRSSQARRQARRTIHVHRTATPPATPTTSNRISMISP
ncbi:hypothetical protein [Streptomyces sp. NPDC054842]